MISYPHFKFLLSNERFDFFVNYLYSVYIIFTKGADIFGHDCITQNWLVNLLFSYCGCTIKYFFWIDPIHFYCKFLLVPRFFGRVKRKLVLKCMPQILPIMLNLH